MPTNPEMRAAFEAAILAEPDEDTPRLIYADWLEENGEPGRAEFIRVQCELARLPASDPRRGALEDRQDDLLAAHEIDWLGPPSPHLEKWSFQRGFVDHVTLIGTDNLAGIEELFARHPVRRVTFDGLEGTLAGLLGSPLLERLTGLVLEDPTEDIAEDEDAFPALLTSPRLAHLTELSVWGDLAGDSCLPLLASRPGAERLAALRLDDLSNAGVARLLAEPGLAGVTTLGFCPGSGPGTIGFGTLAARSERWNAFDMPSVRVTGTGFRHLAACGRLRQLVCEWGAGQGRSLSLPAGLRHLRLDLRSEAVPPFAALARLECLPNLEELRLDLRHNGDDPPDAARLQGLGHILERLSGPVLHLNVLGNALPLAALTQLPGLERLRSLGIRNGRLTDKDVRSLVKCTRLTGLRTLWLVNCKTVTARRLEMLVEAPFVSELQEFSLFDAKLGDRGVRTVLEVPRWRRLTGLSLNATGMGAAGVAALAAWPGLPRLRELNLSRNPMDTRAIRLLLQAPGLSPLVRLSIHGMGQGADPRMRAEVAPLAERLGHRFTF
jgi:uncharacterized protein (TIGR02996 family)